MLVSPAAEDSGGVPDLGDGVCVADVAAGRAFHLPGSSLAEARRLASSLGASPRTTLYQADDPEVAS
jgi:hypothetical protein